MDRLIFFSLPLSSNDWSIIFFLYQLFTLYSRYIVAHFIYNSILLTFNLQDTKHEILLYKCSQFKTTSKLQKDYLHYRETVYFEEEQI